MYNNFNIGLFFIPAIKVRNSLRILPTQLGIVLSSKIQEHICVWFFQEQYSLRHPRSPIPVMSNDVMFCAHGIFATALTMGQCYIYDKGDQRFSTVAKAIVGLCSLINVVAALMALFDVIMWLDVLYISSYLKLCYTLKKYIPQV